MPLNPSNPIPIALCITELNTGGAERCLAQLVLRLNRERFHPVVYSLGPRPDSDATADDQRCSTADQTPAAQIEAAGIPTVYLNARDWRQGPWTCARLRAALCRQRPLLLQTFLYHANVLGRLAAAMAGVPHVVSGIRVAEPRSPSRLWIEWLTAGLVERHVCVSQAVKQFSIERGKLPPDRCLVIPNGIDYESLAGARPMDRAAWGLPSDGPLLLYVGRMDAQKRIDWLIRRAGEFLPRLPDATLVLIGGGPLRTAAERLAEGLGIAPRCRFLGQQSHCLVRGFLRAASVLLVSSGWEGLPNVVLEGMASGLPMVACDAEGVREALGPAAARQVVPIHDAAEFTRRVLELLNDADAARTLGLQNQRRAECEFRIERMVERYAALYDSLLSGSPV